MKRVVYVLMALLPLSASANAQGKIEKSGGVTTDAVVARLMSFDRDGDGRLVAGELADRMHPLLTRADTDGNSALDASEIRAAATVAPPQIVQQHLFPVGSYVFADEGELSSRSHTEGVLQDLRLAPTTMTRARTIAMAFTDMIEAEAKAEFLADVTPLLTAPQRTVVEKALAQPRVRARSVHLDGGASAGQIVKVFSMDVEMQISHLGLPPAQHEQAKAAAERFKARLRLTDADRAQLAEHLAGLLTAEEHENFLAALGRRPLVQAGRLVMVENAH